MTEALDSVDEDEHGHGHGGQSTGERLIYMANQIARFFRAQPADTAALGVADHIKAFWDPEMRRRIFAHVDEGGAGLDPLAMEALTRLRDGAKVGAALQARGEHSAREPGDDAG